MPSIRAQNDLWRELCVSLVGAFRVPPVSEWYEARPLAFKPPDGDLPSDLVQAAVISLSGRKKGAAAPLQLVHFLQRLS